MRPRTLVTVAILLLCTSARADEPAPGAAPPLPSYETTVTALRLARPLPDVPAPVTVVPREEIDRTPGLTTDDLVRAQPSAATFRRTPSLVADPTAQGLSLRGVGPSGVSRALVLLDGVPVNDPFGGWVYWQSLPRLGLDRIEIAPGGTSALYGNYAMGGVVQLVSRPIENAVDADAGYGSLDTRYAAGRVAGRAGIVGASLEAEGLSSDGYVQVSEDQRGAIDRPASSDHVALVGRVEVAPAAGRRLTAHLRYFDEDENGGTEFTTAHVRTIDYGLGYVHDAGALGTLQLSLHGSVERFQQTRARIAAMRASEAKSAEQEVPSNAQGASAVWTSPTLRAGGTHVLLGGLDARQVEGHASETLYPAAMMPPPTTLLARDGGGRQRFGGVFVEDVYDPAAWLEVQAAVRVDVWANQDGHRNTRLADDTTTSDTFDDHVATELSPRVGLLVRVDPKTRLRGAAYRAFRAPTLNELYRPFQVGTVLTAANEALQSEHLLGFELGAERLLGDVGAVRATGFLTFLDDPIVNATLPPMMPMPPGAPQRQRENLGRAQIRGLEVSADVRLGQRLIANAAYTLADATVLDAGGQAGIEGNRLPQDPVHRVHVALSGRPHRRVLLSVQVRAQSEQFEDDLNTLPMGGFVVFDAFASARIAWGLEAFGSGQNLLDRRYLVGRAGVDTIGPPRILMAGLRYRY